MVSNFSPNYFLELIKWEREGDVSAVVESHITSEFLEATCPGHLHVGCADCGYRGDLFSPTHLLLCVPRIGATTPPNGHANTDGYWWTAQDEVMAQYEDDSQYDDDKREVDTFTADILADYDR